jgi:hypothetical protein
MFRYGSRLQHAVNTLQLVRERGRPRQKERLSSVAPIHYVPQVIQGAD